MRLFKKYDDKKLEMLHIARELVLAIALAVVIFGFLIGISLVSGPSMHPTLKDRQPVVYSRISRDFNVGDVVSVRMPNGEYYVKRIVAMAGDTVEVKDGALYVNGERETRETVHGVTEPQEGEVVYPLTVPLGQVFVLGDNREVSIDSRTYGPVATSQIRGKLFFVK
ncbi:MAG: signal peptidase I [Clostridia bacterium]|nr:signal peptidase I [Clostridia bacterium]